VFVCGRKATILSFFYILEWNCVPTIFYKLRQLKEPRMLFVAAFWAVHVFTFEGSGPAITTCNHGSLDLKQEIQIQIEMFVQARWQCGAGERCRGQVESQV
jgi:hypothetical protein